MKLSLDWLSEYCEWKENAATLAERLTMSGTEVEAIITTGVNIPQIITAKILSSKRHPNADRLTVCEVSDGETTRQIVCGATNHKEGDIVPLALPGAQLPGGLTIKASKLRGEMSEGMMCSAKELGLGADASGLLILPPETPLGRPIAELFPGDVIFEVEITPNRADLLSHRGIARELAALGMKLKAHPKIKQPKFESPKDWKLSVETDDDCPRYTAQLLTNVKVAPSPAWMQKRLEAIGLRPINNVVDITNYVLFELGQPLHAFDADKIRGNHVRVRRARAKETFEALDGKTYAPTPEDLAITDEGGIIALAGVMGGEASGVTESTTSVLIESAVFKPSLVRATSRKLSMMTDASYRFERGIDPALLDEGRERAVALMMELTGASVPCPAWETSPFALQRAVVSLRPERARTIVAMDVSDKRIEEILSRLGCEASGKSQWSIPTWRPDLTREIDLIEEIARIEGLDRVRRSTQMSAAFSSEVDTTRRRNWQLREMLASLGFYEMVTTSMLPQTDGLVSLANPMNEENTCLRADLLSTALPCVARNVAREQRDLRLFEIGRVYLPEKQGQEEMRLLLLGAGCECLPHWTQAERLFDFFSLKGVWEAIAAQFPEIQPPATFGAVDAALLKKHGIKVPVFAAEVALPPPPMQADVKFKPMPQYPAVTRDLAFVVDQPVSQQEIFDAIRRAGIAELEAVTCFDLFHDVEGKKLPANKKSLAYTLTYRSNERTLKENEVSQWEQTIVNAVGRATGAELRA